MKPKKYFNDAKNTLQVELTRSAIGYLKSGLRLFHKEQEGSYACIEPAIGNLSIAIELMLKAFLVKYNPILVFKEPDLELVTLFTCSDAIPSKDFNRRKYDSVLCSSKSKTIGLDEAVLGFYIFAPKYKQSLKPYFDFLSKCRNASIHYSLPSFEKYELERTAYLALRVSQILQEHKTFGGIGYSRTKKDNIFLMLFNDERARRVSEKIANARAKAMKIVSSDVTIDLQDKYWDMIETTCPICASKAVLTGYTEPQADEDDEGNLDQYLAFIANTFQCGECGLKLDDSEEMKRAGVAVQYDRPEEDNQRWVSDFEPADDVI